MFLQELTSIKGIGEWTVHMFQMFHLRRPDILPIGDLGVRKGMQKVYKLSKLPGRQEMEQIAEEWRPYRSVGAFYMWRSQEPPKADDENDAATMAVATPDKRSEDATKKRMKGTPGGVCPSPWLDGANDLVATPPKRKRKKDEDA